MKTLGNRGSARYHDRGCSSGLFYQFDGYIDMAYWLILIFSPLDIDGYPLESVSYLRFLLFCFVL